MKALALARKSAIAAANSLKANAKLLSSPALRQALFSVPRKYRDNVTVELSRFDREAFAHLTVRDVDGFKSREVGRLLEGFVGDEWKATTKDWAEYGHRTYQFKRSLTTGDGLGLGLTVTFDVYPKAESTTCRAVVKGYRTHTERIAEMEYVCD